MSDFEAYQTNPKLNSFDVEYLTGNWIGPPGAALWSVHEFCMNNGLGGYGQPTEKGLRLLQEYGTKQ